MSGQPRPHPEAAQSLVMGMLDVPNEPVSVTKSAAVERSCRSRGGLNPIDIQVGSRIRVRRTLMGMSQERLGEALGLTFQQVQKYERGVNRVSASRLYDLSHVLDVPISFFYDDMPESVGGARSSAGGPDGLSAGQDSFGDDTPSRRETLELVRAYYRITNAAVRKRMLDLIKSLIPNAGQQDARSLA